MPAGPAERGSRSSSLLDEARALLQEAEKSLSAIDLVLGKKLKGYRVVKDNDARLIEERDRVRSDVILTRLALARIVYDKAQTYEPGSKEWRELLAAAAAQFSQNYWKYNRWLGGYEFRIQEARCQKELGHYAQAIQILEELASPQPGDDEKARRFRTHGHRDGPANRLAAAGEEV